MNEKNLNHEKHEMHEKGKKENFRDFRAFRGYKSYKPSGVEWLGDVPAHWDLKAIKWTTPVFRGASPRPIDDPVYFDDEGEYAWVRIADVTASGVYLEETTQRLSDVGSSLSVKMQPGSLFLSIAGTVGLPCITKIKCCIHDGFVYFPRLKSDTKYMYYIFACGEPYKGLGKMGTQLNLNTDTVGSIIMGFPPLPEQQAIAAFLDLETGRIDALIAKKERLLELLAEQRTALISRAVTKGLSGLVSGGDEEETFTRRRGERGGEDDFSEFSKPVRYKPSGVEWLGDVPAHWEVKKLKWAYQGIGSGDGISPDDIDTTGTYPVYGGNGIMGYTEVFNSNNTDIIIGRVGAKCGNVYIVDGPKWISDNALKLKINRVDLKYIALILEHRNLNQLANQNAQPLITGSMVGNQFLPFPPLPEQHAIAAFLDRETAKIDALSVNVSAVIERLKEYRTALISSAVTGKIDVASTEKTEEGKNLNHGKHG